MRGGLAAGAVALVLAGTAAAATLTTVFAPTTVAPLRLSHSDVGALADFMGLVPHIGQGQGSQGQGGQSQSQGQSAGGKVLHGKILGGFPAASGTRTTSWGTVRWASSGSPQTAPTPADAARVAGFPVSVPATLPSGVVGPPRIEVQPQVQVTVTFDPGVASVGGSSVVLTAGPAVLVAYGAATGPGVPTLGILTMPRPVATSSGATTSQIMAFLLDQHGLPADLRQEIRLLGDVGTTLPVPVPAGAVEQSVEVGGSPGVLVADPSGIASGVVWEDGAGTLRAVAGLVDQQDALGVADQLG